jgi:Phosphotransferase enzyme family
MARPADRLPEALASIFTSNDGHRGAPVAMRRLPTPYITTFPCEIVTCEFADYSRLRLFCKYAERDEKCSFGQRGGVSYEAEVYRRVLQPLGASAPIYYGSWRDACTGGVWLILEYVNRSLRAGKVPRLRAMKMASRWIGQFHGNNERGGARARFLNAYDTAYYAGWTRRSSACGRRLRLPLPWLATLSRRLEREIATLAALPQTVIHGEYYPHNILFQSGVIRPVDWETAALAPGEIDLATLCEGWGPEDCRLLETEYQRARWPGGGAPPEFRRNLDLAGIYMQLRWLGDNDPRWSRNMTRWERLYAASKRLGLI